MSNFINYEFDVNSAPVLDPIGPQTTTEGVNLNFAVSATDPDGTVPVLSTSSLPSGAVFIDNNDGSGVFDWTPGFTQSSIYSVTFYASDGVLVDSEVVSVTVREAGNQSPVLDPIGPQTTTEGVNLNFGVSATDPDETIPSLNTSSLPSGAVFIDNSDGSSVFNWTPDLTQSGIHDVTFYATDGVLVDSEVVTITVEDSGVPKNSSESPDNLPESYSLGQNYPNPFNPTTEITFALPTISDVRLEIFNILGQKVATLVDSRLEAGRHTVTWNGSNVGSGTYFYRLNTGAFVETKKMMLLK